MHIDLVPEFDAQLEEEVEASEDYELNSEEVGNCKVAFKAFDMHGNGTISTKEMRHILKVMGLKNLSTKEVSLIISFADRENLGYISFNQFIRIIAD